MEAKRKKEKTRGQMADLTVKTLPTTGTIPTVNNASTTANTAGVGSTTLPLVNNQTNAVKEMPKVKGPSLDETLTKFYGKKYTEASEEEKEKLIVKYFDWLSKDKKDIINQFDQFKLYRQRCKSDGEYKRLSSVIDKMETKYQFGAAKTVITQGTDNQKRIGQKAVADDYHNYDKSVQVGVSKLIVESENTEAIKIAAGHASQTDKTNQTEVVKTFQSIDNVEVNKLLIDQYGAYDKSNEIDIHKIMSSSQHSETIEYAASSIYHFDKENQAGAVKITTATGNEKAINAAAANYSKYDESARGEIKETINNSGYESAKNTLSEAEIKQAQESIVEKATEEENPTQKYSTSNEKNPIREIIESKAINKFILIKDAFSKASTADKDAWIKSLQPYEIAMIINIIPTSDLPKILKLINPSDTETQRAVIERIGLKQASKSFGILSASMQKLCLNNNISKIEFGLIQKNQLSNFVKEDYNELLKKQNKS